MIPSPQTNEDLNTALFLMASLSPKVKESIELELYRQTADSDQSTEQYIVEDAFVNLIHEIEGLGLTIAFNHSDVVLETGPLFKFLKYVTYLLPNSLYDILKTKPKIRECVGHILGGSLGDDETLIQTYLSELGGLDGQDPLVPDLVDVIDTYYPVTTQTTVFTDYMRNLYDLIIHETLMLESDEASHSLYRDTLKDIIGRLSDAVNLFESHLLYGFLCGVQDRIIKDFTAPANFNDYLYLFTLKPSDLPEELIPSYEQKWYHYNVSNMWCPEYFKIRQTEALDTTVIMMYCFKYAVCPTLQDYDAKTVLLRQVYPNAEVEDIIKPLYQER